MSRLFKELLKDESGATAIEYGLIAAGISLAIISAVNGLGTNLRTRFTSINSSLRQRASGADLTFATLPTTHA